MTARIVNVVLGAWLFVSAFLWPHSGSQLTNTWICGLLAGAFALIAMKVEEVRFLNTALSIWLFIAAFALPTYAAGTIWNNALVAIAMFIVSLVPNETVGHGRRLTYRRRTQLPV
jgi:hypothetical protein